MLPLLLLFVIVVVVVVVVVAAVVVIGNVSVVKVGKSGQIAGRGRYGLNERVQLVLLLGKRVERVQEQVVLILIVL